MDQDLVLLIIVVLLVVGRILNKKRKIDSDPEIKSGLDKIEKFMNAVEFGKRDYFRYSHKEQLKKEYHDLFIKFNSRAYKRISSKESVKKFINTYSKLDQLVKAWNSSYIEKEISGCERLLNDIDGKSLDTEQRKAVVVDDDNNLVIAGAGSGKTLTISAKVKYLVEKKHVKPDEILLISYTRKAAEEMQDRIANRLGLNVETMTFHKLGLEIVSKKRGKRPDVAETLAAVVEEYFQEEIKSKRDLLKTLVEFFGYYLNIPKDLESCKSLGEAIEHNKSSDFETIRSKVESRTSELKDNKVTIMGENVKSIEEVIIANFLYLNGVKYTYEKVYPHETSDVYRKQYRPDFYLDDYDIYLEHFGVTEDMKVPWLPPIEAKKYVSSIKWKRDLHKEMNTTLIETYSYYSSKGILIIKLDELLRMNGVKYREVDFAQIYEQVYSHNNDKNFGEFKKLIVSFIGLFKSKGYTDIGFDHLIKSARSEKNSFMSRRAILFLSIVKPLYQKYQDSLLASGQIDFNDMINLATDLINQGELFRPLKYIIIDEYQDISANRFNLIKALKNQHNSKVMAVGDDWQSIFRFAGSDIALFTRFDDFLGYSEILRIQKTYRNSQELIDIAGKFVMKNPKQLKKKLTTDKHINTPIKLYTYNSKPEPALVNAIDEIVETNGPEAEVMILGRTNYDIEMLNNAHFKIMRSSKGAIIKCIKHPGLKLSFLTVHRSKGLEADNVIVLNLENKLLGFPNKISDDPILSLVLTDKDEFDFAEERRLFYVAITRTRKSTYLIAPDKNPSVFVEELIKTEAIKFKPATGEVSIKNNPRCPVCLTGYLVIRESNASQEKFLGCSNYPHCDKTLKNVELIDGYVKCNSCGGYVVKRKGQYGDFFGCTNYPICTSTIKIVGS